MLYHDNAICEWGPCSKDLPQHRYDPTKRRFCSYECSVKWHKKYEPGSTVPNPDERWN